MNEEIKFNDLLFKALDHAMQSISSGGTLIPFVMTQTEIHRFAAEKNEKSKEEAEKYMLQQSEEPRLILAYAGFISVDNEKNDAIFVEGLDRKRKQKIVLAQRYMPALHEQVFKIIGNPVLVYRGDLGL